MRSLVDGIWEVRNSLSSGRTARVLFYVESNYMELLHGFMKKTQKASQQKIDLAIKRMKTSRAGRKMNTLDLRSIAGFGKKASTKK